MIKYERVFPEHVTTKDTRPTQGKNKEKSDHVKEQKYKVKEQK